MYNYNLISNESYSFQIPHSSPSPTIEIENKIKDSEDETTDGNLY